MIFHTSFSTFDKTKTKTCIKDLRRDSLHVNVKGNYRYLKCYAVAHAQAVLVFY